MRESDSAQLTLRDAAATRALGAAFARALRAAQGESWVIFLEGELGAGKTTLVGGLLAEFGFAGPVRSPTYTLVEPYELQGHRPLHHVDLYRLAVPDEVEPLGLRDLLDHAGILLIEWPSKGADRIPSADISIRLVYAADGTQRKVLVSPDTSKGRKLVAGIIGVMEQ